MKDAIQILSNLEDLIKAGPRGGKYYKRVPTGNPKRPYDYFYSKEEYERHIGKKHVNGEEAKKRNADKRHIQNAKESISRGKRLLKELGSKVPKETRDNFKKRAAKVDEFAGMGPSGPYRAEQHARSVYIDLIDDLREKLGNQVLGEARAKAAQKMTKSAMYFDRSREMTEDLIKHKYIRRTPKPGGGYNYEYADDKKGRKKGGKKASSGDEATVQRVVSQAKKEFAAAKKRGDFEKFEDVPGPGVSLDKNFDVNLYAGKHGYNANVNLNDDVSDKLYRRGALSEDAELTQDVGTFKTLEEAVRAAVAKKNEMAKQLGLAGKKREKAKKSSGSSMSLLKSQMPGLGLDPDSEYDNELFKALLDAPEIPEHTRLSKGLYEFSQGDAKPQRLPDEYLPAYLDSFLEQAFEKEMNEAAHRKLRLHSDGDPDDYMAQMVYNQLMCYAVKNKNLLRACKNHKVTRDYVKGRLRAMNLTVPDTSQDEAARSSANDGPVFNPDGFSGDAVNEAYKSHNATFANAQNELKKSTEAVGALAPRPEPIVLEDDRGDPAASLHKSLTRRVDQSWGLPHHDEAIKKGPADRRTELMPDAAPLNERGSSRRQ